MSWSVAFHPKFLAEYDELTEAVQDGLVAGDKSGVSEPKFFKRLIDKADRRFKEHLDTLSSKE